MKNTCSFWRSPPITPIASPKLVPAKAGIHLLMTWRMRQRHEGLPAPAFGDPDVILHHRVAASKAVLRLEAFENPLSGVPLLRRRHASDTKIASMTGSSAPGFGLPGGFDRT
jgi:hypothetical protein